MQILLTRTEYDQVTREHLAALLPAAKAEREFQRQYPKTADESLLELWARGVQIASLPPDRGYTSLEMDNLVAAADLAGWWSPEAENAKASGLTLSEYREAIENPGHLLHRSVLR